MMPHLSIGPRYSCSSRAGARLFRHVQLALRDWMETKTDSLRSRYDAETAVIYTYEPNCEVRWGMKVTGSKQVSIKERSR